MSIKKAYVCLSGFMVTMLLIGLSGCSTNKGTGDKPDRVQLQIENNLLTKGKQVVTLSIIPMVQQLYATTLALPQMPENSICTADIGPVYTLVFLQGEKTLASVVAERYGCKAVTIAGEKRQATKDFWSQLDAAIIQATPTAGTQ